MARGQGDRAAVGLVCLRACLFEQEPSDRAVHDLQHGRQQQGPRRQQQAQRDRQRQHRLAHRHMGDDVADQVRRRLRHAPGTARRAKAAPLAAESDQLVVPAVAAAQAQEAVGPGCRRIGFSNALFPSPWQPGSLRLLPEHDRRTSCWSRARLVLCCLT